MYPGIHGDSLTCNFISKNETYLFILSSIILRDNCPKKLGHYVVGQILHILWALRGKHREDQAEMQEISSCSFFLHYTFVEKMWG